LRPLRVLRVRARQIAGGDYARRTGVRSRDEIGDLARELDAMADAVEEREHRLIRSERLATVGRMAAQVTHEVRNPLASIGLYAELLGDEAGASGEARRLVDSISSEVDRLTEITENYLRFAKLPQPKLEHEDLSALVASVAEFARAELMPQFRLTCDRDALDSNDFIAGFKAGFRSRRFRMAGCNDRFSGVRIAAAQTHTQQAGTKIFAFSQSIQHPVNVF
jgi:signal transduction histidine kinase